ncbi:MAG: PTS fructose transporter subunit IIA [Phycisphaerae bacterium]|nr:PTS fructose transporter subunit IIA [Phycisphaerae bacterium]MBM90743.1 PTS fructose transporter subunit IIA [Phycisphaerae bacterium]
MKMTEIIRPGSIRVPLESTERDDAIRELIDALVESGAAPAEIRDDLLEKVLERERKHSTGFGRGVAVPHVKHPKIETMAAAIGISPGGIEFNSLDKQPVYTIFLLLSPQSRPEEHLQAMEVIFKSLSKETFRRTLRQAEDAQKIHDLLDDADNHRVVG